MRGEHERDGALAGHRPQRGKLLGTTASLSGVAPAELRPTRGVVPEPLPQGRAVPQALQLRYLAMLFEIAGERTSTIVFPFPIDLIQSRMSQMAGGAGKAD